MAIRSTVFYIYYFIFDKVNFNFELCSIPVDKIKKNSSNSFFASENTDAIDADLSE